jgi:hypothetical protein
VQRQQASVTEQRAEVMQEVSLSEDVLGRQHLQAKLDRLGRSVEHGEALPGYCEPVRRKLQTFDAAAKRLAFEHESTCGGVVQVVSRPFCATGSGVVSG